MKTDIPDCVREFYSYIYPDLDWDRVEFHEGIPLLFRWRNPGAITLGSWTSSKINIHFKPGEGDPCTCKGISLIGHELFHVQDILSIGRGWGFGLIRLWYLAYVYCGIMSGFSFGKRHYLEEPAYDVQEKIKEYFKRIGLSLSQEGPCISTELDVSWNPNFFSQFPSNRPDLVIRKQNRSFIKVLLESTRRGFGNLLKLLKR